MTFKEFRARVIEIGNLLSEVPGFDSVVVIVVNNDLEKIVIGGRTEGNPRDLIAAALANVSDA